MSELAVIWTLSEDYSDEVPEDFDSQKSVEYVLIIDVGTSLKHALEDRQCRPVFLTWPRIARHGFAVAGESLAEGKVCGTDKEDEKCHDFG